MAGAQRGWRHTGAQNLLQHPRGILLRGPLPRVEPTQRLGLAHRRLAPSAHLLKDLSFRSKILPRCGRCGGASGWMLTRRVDCLQTRGGNQSCSTSLLGARPRGTPWARGRARGHASPVQERARGSRPRTAPSCRRANPRQGGPVALSLAQRWFLQRRAPAAVVARAQPGGAAAGGWCAGEAPSNSPLAGSASIAPASFDAFSH